MTKFELRNADRPRASYYESYQIHECLGTIVCEYTVTRGDDSITIDGTVYLGGACNEALSSVSASNVKFVVAPHSSQSSIQTYKTALIPLNSFHIPSTSSNWAYSSEKKSFSLTVPLVHSEYDADFYLEGTLTATVCLSHTSSVSLKKWPVCGNLGSVSKRRSYTVTYNANGGSSTPAADAKWHNETLTLASEIIRTGYRLNGWLKNGGGSVLSTYTDNEACVMYANWSPNVYTIVYNGNGNTGGSTAASSHTYDVQKALTANGFTKTDYLFKGWATTQDGPAAFADGQQVANLTATHGGTVNLYAVWEKAYVDPNILNLSVERVRPTTVNNDTVYVLDDEGKIGKVFITANPGKKKSVPGDQNPQPIPTRLQIYYKRSVSDASEQNLLELITYDTINTDGASSTQYIDATSTGKTGFEIGTDEQCEILVIAQGIDDNAVKCTALRSTVLMVAKYIVDFNQNPQYDSVGFFGVAPDINDVVYVKGDILIEVDPNSGTDELYNAIHALGWDNDVLIN